MIQPRAVTVCVDYDDLLRVTLPSAAATFAEIVVMTTPAQAARVAELARPYPHVRVQPTEVFYAGGALFNKGAAVEEGFTKLGRHGWLAVFDADIVFPPGLIPSGPYPDRLYTAPRKVLASPAALVKGLDWSALPACRDPEPAGYFLLFHAYDRALDGPPWYGTRWRHAGGCDAEFVHRWNPARWIWLPQPVLHLGSPWENWAGRVTPRWDTGAVPPEAGQRREALQDLLSRRKAYRRTHRGLSCPEERLG